MQLTSATPLAETENLDVYPAAPEGFNVARENIPHGEVTIVGYDSKTLGLRRMLRVYTPPGYTPDRKFPVLYLQHGLGNTSTDGRSGPALRSSSTTCWPKKNCAAVHHRFPQRKRDRDDDRRKAGRPYPGVLRDALS